jgi:hypothetical protein
MADGEEDREAEELLVLRLLANFDDERPTEIKSLDPDSPDEKRARAILAKQVREGRLGGITKELLALAIDPWSGSTWPGMRPVRKIRFNSATTGPPSTWARDLVVVDFIRKHLREGFPEDAALHAAEMKFDLGKSQTHSVWHRWKTLTGYGSSGQ